MWIPASDLEELLNAQLVNVSLAKLPLRTRSKVLKGLVCQALGYPVPAQFRRTRPRFPGQLFDTYVQKSNNLQIWNEELAPTRRYVIIRLQQDDVITKVKVVTGDTLALLDTTGTLTQKYQARLIPGEAGSELVTDIDTNRLQPFVRTSVQLSSVASPADHPQAGQLLEIKEIYKRLKCLVGAQFRYVGSDQDRNRGVQLQRLVCQQLGYAECQDHGKFPDVPHQLLEIKLQTSGTVDLGLVRPDSREPLDVPKIQGRQVRHCDVRYALFYAVTDGEKVTLTHFFLTTGENFFTRLRQFQGKVLNKKLQIPLPAAFFGD